MGVVEMLMNRVLKCVQRPIGVYHSSVFYQFSGHFGVSCIACSTRTGQLFVGRYDFSSGSAKPGVVTVINADGSFAYDIPVSGSEISGLALSHDESTLIITEESTNNVYSVQIKQGY